MIRAYLKERRSWIVMMLALQGLGLFIAAVDPMIPVLSMLYVAFLSTLLFVIFLVFRYYKETRFYKSLLQREHNLDMTTIADASSPLERIVAESLTGEIEQLRQDAAMNRLLLEQEKDELLAWIHEVKTPLTAMRLMMDRMQHDPVKAQLHVEWLRLHHLLDQQLHQKRLPFMENDLYIDAVNLEDIVVQEIKTLQAWCIQKGLGFDIQLAVTEVLSDAKWLSFILRQLLSNAVKYSEQADITILSEQRRQHTVLLIRDAGMGIDPKDLPRIFDKGFTSTTEHQNGAATGMGLYLAKKAAQSLHIAIDAASTPGEGTTFTLTFPKRNEFVTTQSM
ncbi:sensor histidine kinase [Xylanibacillus composti]|uniref:histidine kinase n=1 Tax=Xylanibacillus composti TaxID=1572762 RepID=A0A8J4H3V3_9BACL|nr:sensor histidine kinase [Xylanibacillus composti]MDT9725394.1 sensor histidine kinase [Xylanibacillus composti]GIQ69160.1 sensor protein BceS [Xylanibacillus composti]